MKKLTQQQIKVFQKTVLEYYRQYGRDIPWRGTNNPYHILVSEVMLQQTQVDRVQPTFRQFIKHFPTVTSLASAKTGDILTAWQGLGYNRRALALQRAAQKIITEHQSKVPKTPEELEQLPGIGPYTAAAVAVFAYRQPVAVIETNIRSVFIHRFFPRRKKVRDDELLPLIQQTLDTKDPATWYHALMDYGAHLKKQHANPSRRSKHHARQSRFEGSSRQLRGSIIRLLTERKKLTEYQLSQLTNRKLVDVAKTTRQLEAEGFIVRRGNTFQLNEK